MGAGRVRESGVLPIGNEIPAVPPVALNPLKRQPCFQNQVGAGASLSGREGFHHRLRKNRHAPISDREWTRGVFS